MTTKNILLHYTHNNIYRCLSKNIVQHRPASWTIEVQPLHKNLFAIFNAVKPNTVFLPASEYTQEFHDFITEYHKVIDIYLLVEHNINNQSLLDFWKSANVKIITRPECIGFYQHYHHLVLDTLYDSDVFINQHLIRNEKIAVILSNEDKINDTLRPWLYPKFTASSLVLFNNPSFKHPQNVGIFNGADLNVVLNTFNHLIDLDNRFSLEADVCGIPVINHEQVLSAGLSKPYALMRSCRTKPLAELSYRYFVETHLIPFWSAAI